MPAAFWLVISMTSKTRPATRWMSFPAMSIPLLLVSLVARAEARSRDLREDGLLVIDRSAAVVLHSAGRIVRRDEQRVDVPARDRKTEVVADERAGGARIAMRGAGHLADAAKILVWI